MKRILLVFLLGFSSQAMAYSIGGMVFCDANLNGVFDEGEQPLAGVEVQLTKVSDPGINTITTATTGADGKFLVNLQSLYGTLLPRGDWEVTIIGGLGAGGSTVAPASGTWEIHLTAAGATSSFLNANFAVDDPACRPVDFGACWMTAGGVKFESVVGEDMAQHGPKDSFGGVVYPSCSSQPSNGGQWNHVAHSLQLHFQGTDISVIRCGNVDGIEPGSESPVTPWNFIEFEGVGWIQGIKGNKLQKNPVVFTARVEDRNEPGNEGAADGEDIDRYRLLVTSPSGEVYFEIGDVETQQMVTITGGNLQLHASSCDD